MQALTGELQIIIAATLLVFLITTFVAIFIIIHQRRYNQHLQERDRLKADFEQETLKAQIEVREQTMNSISQEIHDNIGQLLSLVKLNLNTLEWDDDNSLKEKIGTSNDLVSRAIEGLRNLSRTMNTDYLQSENLTNTLRIELDLIKKTGLYEIDFNAKGNEHRLSPKKQLIVYRIAQECLSNVLKHAEADRITCDLDFSQDSFILKITDNGIGFGDQAEHQKNGNKPGTGLKNLYFRTGIIGGTLEINSMPENGTSIKLTVPYQET